MNNLRLILLGIGILIIASIYFWEVFKQQRLRKRAFVSEPEEHKFPELRIKPATETDASYSEELSDLNELMANHRESHVDEDTISGTVSFQDGKRSSEKDHSAADAAGREHSSPSEPHNTGSKSATDIPVREPNVFFYITAPDKMHFTGTEIFQAAEMVGLEHGAMDIFHHFGPAHRNYEQPLFSMANIFEPGYFKPEMMDSFTTRGIVIFMYPSDKPDPGINTELLINTVLQLADILGGEIRGKDHQLITETALSAIREEVRNVSR